LEYLTSNSFTPAQAGARLDVVQAIEIILENILPAFAGMTDLVDLIQL
jgi:hypothetical protein